MGIRADPIVDPTAVPLVRSRLGRRRSQSCPVSHQAASREPSQSSHGSPAMVATECVAILSMAGCIARPSLGACRARNTTSRQPQPELMTTRPTRSELVDAIWPEPAEGIWRRGPALRPPWIAAPAGLARAVEPTGAPARAAGRGRRPGDGPGVHARSRIRSRAPQPVRRAGRWWRQGPVRRDHRVRPSPGSRRSPQVGSHLADGAAPDHRAGGANGGGGWERPCCAAHWPAAARSIAPSH